MQTREPNYTNRSIVKAVSILQCFTPREQELNASGVARKVKIPRTTAFRILTTLSEAGMLLRNEKTGNYSVGPTLYALGSIYLETTDIFKAADPVIKTLNELTEEVVCVAILDRGNAVLTMIEEARYYFRFARRVGSIITSYASSIGRALLSELTEVELDNLIPEEKLRPITKKTIATKTELKRKLEQIRETGVSFDSEGSYEGIEGIASVIRDASGKAVAAMCFSVPIFRLNQAKRKKLAKLIKLGAGLISYRLGYQDKVNPVQSIEEIRAWWEKDKPG